MADYINVTSLNRLAKRVLEQCDPLNDLIVCGEISGFTRHYKSGHLYFTLKDENASIKTVMFRSQAQLLNFEPQNGMLVLVYGRATIYERDGAFQLYADYMKPFGAGAAQMAFDALYKKLETEGLFAPERKRPLPAVPRCIGVVTSKTGAAWQDVQNVIGRRWPMVKLLLAPVSVQGIEAEKSIVDGIRRLDRDPRPDLIWTPLLLHPTYSIFITHSLNTLFPSPSSFLLSRSALRQSHPQLIFHIISIFLPTSFF